MSTRKSLRLLAVVAMVTTVLVSATVASAGVLQPCNGVTFDPANPSHVFYGDGSANGTDVDRSAAPGPQIFFWNGSGGGVDLVGSAFDDVICGTPSDDEIWGGKGNDLIFGEGGSDDLYGNGGDDTIFNGGFAGGAAPNGPGSEPSSSPGDIWGGKGNDLIYTGNDSDEVEAGAGDDVINAKDFGHGGSGNAYGQKGDDTLIAGAGAFFFLYGGKGNDTLTLGSAFAQDAYGGAGMDTITGGTGAEHELYGKGGNDTLIAGTGTSQGLFGGGGNDTLSNLGAAADQYAFGNGGNDTITAKTSGAVSFDAYGGKGNDVIKGSPEGDDELFGHSGNDVIWGGDGADYINGGSGSDVMYGNVPAGNGLDTADGDADVMEASSSVLIPGVFGAPDTPATSNTFYGACPGDADTAFASGDGVDTSYNTESNVGIENVVNGCSV
jgi:Ca2+-binding RTX toxin-like protein